MCWYAYLVMNHYSRDYHTGVGGKLVSLWLDIFPRKFYPVGQNFLGKCAPRHIFLKMCPQTHFPADIFNTCGYSA